jgi:hypothetical protein
VPGSARYLIINNDTVVIKQFRDQEWSSLEDELEFVAPIEMKDMKWITLYNECRPLMPPDLRAYYEYFHNDPGPVHREMNKLNKGEATVTRKKRAITNNNEPRRRNGSPTPAEKAAAKVARRSKPKSHQWQRQSQTQRGSRHQKPRARTKSRQPKREDHSVFSVESCM